MFNRIFVYSKTNQADINSKPRYHTSLPCDSKNNISLIYN